MPVQPYDLYSFKLDHSYRYTVKITFIFLVISNENQLTFLMKRSSIRRTDKIKSRRDKLSIISV